MNGELTFSASLWHGLPTVPPVWTAGLPMLRGDLRSFPWHGQETVPQQGAAPAAVRLQEVAP
jgi:hypothetical protein